MPRIAVSAIAFIVVALWAPVGLAGADDAQPSAFENAVGLAKSNMMSAPNVAYEAATNAKDLSDTSNDQNALAISLWLQAEALNRMNDPDAALSTINDALASYAGSNDKLEADILLARARIARVLSDYAVALQSFQAAYDIFE